MNDPAPKRFLDLAARLALRAAGDVEPNPLVGAVLVQGDRTIGMGHHRRYGGPHAEVEALDDSRARGEVARGATMYVTLEPCNHQGKQPACTRALIEAGVARVVIARADPNPVAAGGAEALRQAGILVEFTRVSPAATTLSDPFVKRLTTGLPWVIAKWAQTSGGLIAAPPGEPRWISREASRRRVHLLRARVDGVLTGMGTVRADNPRLTARDVPRLRRVARRIVIDARAELALDSALVATLAEAPLTLVYDQALQGTRAAALKALAERGVELLPAPATAGGIDLRAALLALAARHTLTNVLVETGPRLLAALLDDDLIDEAHVYVAPSPRPDQVASPAAGGLAAPTLTGSRRLAPCTRRRVGVDTLLTYRRPTPDA